MTLTIGNKDRTNKARDEKSTTIIINMGNHHWTIHETHIVKKNFKIMPDFAIAIFLPGRTVCAIACKRRKLNLKYKQEWINEQLKLDRVSPYQFC